MGCPAPGPGERSALIDMADVLDESHESLPSPSNRPTAIGVDKSPDASERAGVGMRGRNGRAGCSFAKFGKRREALAGNGKAETFGPGPTGRARHYRCHGLPRHGVGIHLLRRAILRRSGLGVDPGRQLDRHADVGRWGSEHTPGRVRSDDSWLSLESGSASNPAAAAAE